MALFYSGASVIHDTVKDSQNAQHQDSETEAAYWNSAIIHFSYCNMSKCLNSLECIVSICYVFYSPLNLNWYMTVIPFVEDE